MVRIVRFFLRLVGWLLTPLVAWAASFLGAWLGSLAAPAIGRPTMGLFFSVAAGAVFAIGGTLIWMRTLRKSPELREVLAVTEEGIPVAAIEAEPAEGEQPAGASQP